MQRTLTPFQLTRLGAFSNVTLAAAKALAGIASSSPAMLADAAHSLGDLLGDGVTYWAIKEAQAAPSAMHPWGKGKMETLGTLGLAGVLVGTGGGLAYNGLQTLAEATTATATATATGDPATPLWIAFAAAVGSIGAKEGLYQLTMANAAKSELMIANAWHHRSDALSSFAAAVGIGGAMSGMPLLDPVAGLFVSGLIVREGVKMGRGALRELLDEALEPSRMAPLRATVEAVDGVEGIAAIRARRMGPFLIMEVAIEVDELMSVSAAHDVAVSVSRSLRCRHEEVVNAFVSTEPRGSREILHRHALAVEGEEVALEVATQTPKAAKPRLEVESKIRDVLASDKYAAHMKLSRLTMHRLMTFDDAQWVVVIDVTFLDMSNFAEAPRLAHALKREVEGLPGVAEADVHADLTLSEFEESR